MDSVLNRETKSAPIARITFGHLLVLSIGIVVPATTILYRSCLFDRPFHHSRLSKDGSVSGLDTQKIYTLWLYA
jgi:hypothetical protein